MKQGLLRLLQATQLLRVISSQSASTYANQVIAFVLPWLMLVRTGSALNAGTVAFATAVASLIGTLVGGLIIDRIGDRKTSIISDALSFITVLVLAITLFFDYFSVWLVVILGVLGVFFDGPGMVAKNTMVPSATKHDNIPLIRAISVQQTLQGTAMFIGPLSAGFLIALFSEGITLMAASVLFVVCIFLIGGRKVQILHQKPLTVRQVYADMRGGVMFLAREPFLGPLTIYGPLYMFILGPLTAIVFPAWFVFAGQGAGAMGIFLGAQALGGIIGGFAFAFVATKVSPRKWLIGANAAYSLALFSLIFLEPGSIIAVAAGFLIGLTFAGIIPIIGTAFYSRTPEKLLGRANSISSASAMIVSAPSALFFGWLVNVTSPKVGILAGAIGMSAMAIAALCLPFMKLLDEKKSTRI